MAPYGPSGKGLSEATGVTGEAAWLNAPLVWVLSRPTLSMWLGC